MPADKMMRLFIIQAISSFVSRDYDSGLHYLNEIKMSYAENQTTMNPTLKSLAKEIIQSLDMFAPGATADVFSGSNVETASTPQQEIASQFQQNQEEVKVTEPAQEPAKSVSSDLQDLLERRRAKRKQSD